MQSYFFNYIITAHNKENLIRSVLQSVLKCAGKSSQIFIVLDGCSDGTETIVDQVAASSEITINKIFLPDVHEIKSINAALHTAPQEGRGFNIIIQDDVLLLEPDFENKIINFYEAIGYEKVGLLAFRHGVNITVDNAKEEIREIDLKESVYGVGMGDKPLLPGYYIEKMVGVRSPECISTEAVRRVGYMDEQLAPYTYDDHDFSIRCLVHGLRNFVLAIKFESDLKWGGMRNNPHPEVNAVMERNRKYLYKKHYDFFKGIFADSFINLRWSKAKPAPGFEIDTSEMSAQKSLSFKRRIKLLGYKNYLIFVIKRPLKYFYILCLRISHDDLFKKIIRNFLRFFSNPREFFTIFNNKIKSLKENKIDAGGFPSVKGTTQAESTVLQKYSKMAKVGIVEIGVLDGGTTKEIAEVASVPVYGIDPIIPDSMNSQLIGSEEKIRENLKFYADFHFFKDFSYNTVKGWTNKFDFIWIDGDHSIEGVARDFDDWFPLLESGGYVAFHDSAPVTSEKTSFLGWPGPVLFVNSLKNSEQAVFVETVDSVTIFRKK